MYSKSHMGGGSRSFNPKYHSLHDDGSLTIKASGWEEDSEHWTGFITLLPGESDYDFWHWVVFTRQVTELISENQLDSWRQEYRASQSSHLVSVD